MRKAQSNLLLLLVLFYLFNLILLFYFIILLFYLILQKMSRLLHTHGGGLEVEAWPFTRQSHILHLRWPSGQPGIKARDILSSFWENISSVKAGTVQLIFTSVYTMKSSQIKICNLSSTPECSLRPLPSHYGPRGNHSSDLYHLTWIGGHWCF